MFHVDKHIWRTADGRLVPTGHADAAVLAYAAGQDVTDDEARRLELADVYPQPTAGTKVAPRAADKLAAQSANKAGVVKADTTKGTNP